MALDPEEFVLGFDALWNAGDRDGVLSAVDDESVVELQPDPPPPGQPRYVGREATANFVDTFLLGFHVDSRNFRTEGEEIVWESDVRNDVFQAWAPIPPAAPHGPGSGKDGKLRAFIFSLDQATVERMAVGALSSRGPRIGAEAVCHNVSFTLSEHHRRYDHGTGNALRARHWEVLCGRSAGATLEPRPSGPVREVMVEDERGLRSPEDPMPRTCHH
jgi:hypothetical protein